MSGAPRAPVFLAITFLLAPALLGSGAAGSDGTVPSRLIVVFHDAPRDLTVGSTLHGGTVLDVEAPLHAARVEVTDAQAFLRRVEADDRVRSVEEDRVENWLAFTPNDPRWNDQYGPSQVNAPLVWDTTLGTPARTVCVVDTGIRSTHEDLTGRYLGGHDYVNGDADPWDDHGHGTHVAGIVGAGVHNAKGIAGIANVGILAVKVLGASGSGSTFDVGRGIRWCADNGAHIVLLSVGSTTASDFLRSSGEYAWERGILLVAAAGNSEGGGCSACIMYPAAYDEVVAVTCTTPDRSRCSFSTTGPEAELAAPGLLVLSASRAGDSSYEYRSGTSMSAPHVAGVAALVWEEAPDLTNADVRRVLQVSAADEGASGRDSVFGYGVVDAGAALQAARDMLASVRFRAHFDGADAPEVTLSGLWRISEACSPSPSPPHYLGYHRESACDYDTGGPTAGSAEILVDLAGAPSATLTFDHRFDVEASDRGAFDVMSVEARQSDGPWVLLHQWDSSSPATGNWTSVVANLDAFVGASAHVRFRFETGDEVANAHGGWFLDNVVVQENLRPVANAGLDRSLADPDGNGAATATLDGSASHDPDGTIASYEWRLGEATLATTAVAEVDLPLGRHVVGLTVTDNGGASASDTVVVTVHANRAPVARAGSDLTARDGDGDGAEIVVLDGSASTDPDGSVVAYEWRLGSTLLAEERTLTVALPVGTHALRLVVTDEGGATGADEAVVTVEPNRAPSPSFDLACGDRVCTLDATSSTDMDGTPSSFVWDLGDGNTATGALVQHEYDDAGGYRVTLNVTDDGGASGVAARSVYVGDPRAPPDLPPESPEIPDRRVDLVGDRLEVPWLDVESAWFEADAANLYVGLKVKDVPIADESTPYVVYDVSFRPTHGVPDGSWGGAVPSGSSLVVLRTTALLAPVHHADGVRGALAPRLELVAVVSLSGGGTADVPIARLDGAVDADRDVVWWIVPRALLQDPEPSDVLTWTEARATPTILGAPNAMSSLSDRTGQGDDYAFPAW